MYSLRCCEVHPCVPVFLLLAALQAVADAPWTSPRNVSGVTIESRERADSRFNEYRGAVRLCADLQSVLLFVSNVERIPQWVPWTGAVRQLEQTADGVIYHVVTRAPWPYRPRDMIYALGIHMQGTSATVSMTGLPERIPPVEGMVRMRAASGLWSFEPADEGLMVSLRLWVDPGSGPRLLVNRRAGTTLGKMLGNLRKEFACAAD
jgi:Polyketide cyclase / dehydrase and lipid transport